MSTALGSGINRLRAMVLIHDTEKGDRWVDYLSLARTEEGLTEKLRAGVSQRRWVAWRLLRVEREASLVEDSKTNGCHASH